MRIRSELPAAIDISQSSRRIIDPDFRKVMDNRERTKPLGEKILAGTANKSDVFVWYKSQDPVGEDLMRLALSPSVDNIRQTVEFYLINSRIYQEGARIHLRESGLTADDFALEPGVAAKLKSGDLSPDQIKELLLGMDMLSASGRDAELVTNYRKIPVIPLIVSDGNYREAEDRSISTNITMNTLLERIYTGIMDNPAVRIKTDLAGKQRSKERRILEYGLQAFLMHMCNYGFAESNPQAAHEGRRAFISAGIEYLKEFFIDRDLLTEWVRQDNKGRLLEMLWVFDAYFYLTMQGRDFAQVVPALNNQDMPFADVNGSKGRQKLQLMNKRAIDVLVYDRHGGISYFVQLGQEGKPNSSHASILTVRENGFKDLDPVRLKERLKAYKRAVDADFTEETKTQAMEYVLRTVPDVYSGKYADTDYNMLRRAFELQPDVNSTALLTEIKPLVIFTDRLPLVVQKQFAKNSRL